MKAKAKTFEGKELIGSYVEKLYPATRTHLMHYYVGKCAVFEEVNPATIEYQIGKHWYTADTLLAQLTHLNELMQDHEDVCWKLNNWRDFGKEYVTPEELKAKHEKI